MASSYVNDLRLNEMATGDASGTWGETTNTNLELIAEAFSYGTEAITTNADTHTTTIADGATDPGRSMYLKYTGTLDSACTITIGPNTVSKVWIIENGTSGSQDIILSQGSGANITIPAGDTKVVYSDGAGAGAAFFDAFASLSVVDLTATGIVTAAGTSVFTNLDISGDIDVDGTTNLDVVDIDGAVNMATTALVTGVLTTTAATVFNGGFASNAASTLTVTEGDHVNGLKLINSQAGGYGSALTFQSERSDNNAIVSAAQIRTQGQDSWNSEASADSNLFFATSLNGSLTDKMVIKHDGNVGIGNSVPLGKLTISNAAGANAPSTVTAANTYLQLGSDDYGPSNNGKFMIGFGFTDATNTNSPAYIGYEEVSTSGDTYGDLTFYTRSVTTDTAPTEALRIDASGNVDITYGNLFTDTTSGIFFSGGIGSFTNGIYGVGVNNVAFNVNGSERARIDSSGVLSVPAGYYVGGTAAANLLDDYEEGTWTLTDESGASMSLTVYVAEYTKIGNKVFFEIGMVFPTTSSTAEIRLSLPFTAKATTDNTGGATLVGTDSGRNDLWLVNRNNATFGAGTNLNIGVTNASYSAKQLKLQGAYTAA
jgi:hypothetical protein